MQYALTTRADVTSGLKAAVEAEEKTWRKISGNPPRAKPAAAPDPPPGDDGMREIEFPPTVTTWFAAACYGLEIRGLKEALGVEDEEEIILEAVGRLHWSECVQPYLEECRERENDPGAECERDDDGLGGGDDPDAPG
jgi:hypothetical protein